MDRTPDRSILALTLETPWSPPKLGFRRNCGAFLLRAEDMSTGSYQFVGGNRTYFKAVLLPLFPHVSSRYIAFLNAAAHL